MNAKIFSRVLLLKVFLVLLLVGCTTRQAPTIKPSQAQSNFTPLFSADGEPKGWRVGAWNDVSKPEESVWLVKNGVLHGGDPRGTWLMSEKEYGDFIVEFEFKLGTNGNSGFAMRAPMKGDPAFDGLELQMADFRYNTSAKDSELTGGLYRALAPSKQVYKPGEWNSYHIELGGSRVLVILNGEKIQDADLSAYSEPVKRHDNTLAPALKDRPRRGHIGFQELSRGQDQHSMIRNARIKALD
jgi:hypothetical protein